MEKSRITHHLIEQSQIDIVPIEDLQSSEPPKNLQLKWTEHHRWIQMKTVLPRGVQISKYAIDLSEKFQMIVQDTEGNCYHTEFELYLPVLQWLSAPLSKSVIKVGSKNTGKCIFTKILDSFGQVRCLRVVETIKRQIPIPDARS